MKHLLTLGLALACAGAAMAYPTLTGPTGLVAVPTAQVVDAGTLSVAADWYNTEDEAIVPIRVLYGIGETFEIGASYGLDSRRFTQGAATIERDNALGFNGKWQTPLTLGGFAWALGAQYQTQDSDVVNTTLSGDITATQLYFVGTRAFTEGSEDIIGLNGTLGLNWTNVEVDLPAPLADLDEDAIRVMLGLQAAFPQGWTASVEYQTKDSDIEDDPITSLVVRYPFSENLIGQIGFTNADITLTGSEDHNLFVGVNLVWGGMGE